MNPFRRMVTVGHSARVIIYDGRPTERKRSVKEWLEGDTQCDALYWRPALNNPPPECLWRVRWSASTLMKPFRPKGIFFCWCPEKSFRALCLSSPHFHLSSFLPALCWAAASACSTRPLAPAVSLSTYCLIHFSFSSLLEKCISHRFSTANFILDRQLPNTPSACTLSASMLLLPPFTWWHHWVTRIVDLPYLPTRSGKTFIFVALVIVVYVNFVVGQDVGCCKIWTIWWQDASFLSRLVRLLGLNKPITCFWQSIEWE